MISKFKRVIYRFHHNRSKRGRVGYIGKDSHWPTRSNLQRRKEDRGCRLLYKALNKYLIHFWKVSVLASGFCSEKSLNVAEIFYIKKFDSKNKGYNLTDGGEGMTGWVPSVSVRKNLSRLNSGKKHPKWGKKDSQETRRKKREAALGNKGNLNRHFSSPHKRKIGSAQKNAWSGYTVEQRKKRCDAMSRGWAAGLHGKQRLHNK